MKNQQAEATQKKQSTRVVAFLGTSQYKRTTYEVVQEGGSSFISSETSFATVALVEWLLREGAHIRDVMIICTEDAEKANLYDLQSALKNLMPMAAIEHRRIPHGRGKAQMWEIFSTTQNIFSVPVGTRLVVDITHGFRSQPFFSAAVLAFMMATGKLNSPVEVYYGALDAKPPQIWPLTQFIEVIKWANALHLFLQTGRADAVDNLIEEYRDVAPRGTSPSEPGVRGPLRKIGEAIRKWSEDFETLRVKSLFIDPATAEGLAVAIEKHKKEIASYLPPLVAVLDDIARTFGGSFQKIDQKGTENHKIAFVRCLLDLAMLYVDKGRYLEAIAATREAIITKFAEEKSAWLAGPDFNPAQRSKAEAKAREADQALATMENQTRGPLATILDVRNDLLHAGFNRSPSNARALKDKVEKIVDNAWDIVARLENAPPPPRHVFLNLSNHPSDGWSNEQKISALSLGCAEIVDEPFPNVDPMWDLQQVAEKAREVVDSIFKKHGNRIVHAMVEGEFSMTVELVKRLQGKGVKCYVATTERDVVMEGDVKKSRFRFKRFREYPWIA